MWKVLNVFLLLVFVWIGQTKTLFYQGIRSQGIHLNLTQLSNPISGTIIWEHAGQQEINVNVYPKNGINQLTDFHVKCQVVFPSGAPCNFQLQLPLGQYRLELLGGFTLYNPLNYNITLIVGSSAPQNLNGYTTLSSFMGGKLLKFYSSGDISLDVQFYNSIFQLQFISVYLVSSTSTGSVDYIDYPKSIFSLPVSNQGNTQFQLTLSQGYYFIYVVPMWYLDSASGNYQQLYDQGDWTISFLNLCQNYQYFNSSTYQCQTCGNQPFQTGNIIETYKCQCVDGYVWNDVLNQCLQCSSLNLNGISKIDNFSCSCNSGFTWNSITFACVGNPIQPKNNSTDQEVEKEEDSSAQNNSESQKQGENQHHQSDQNGSNNRRNQKSSDKKNDSKNEEKNNQSTNSNRQNNQNSEEKNRNNQSDQNNQNDKKRDKKEKGKRQK